MSAFNLIISFIFSTIDAIIFINMLSVFREDKDDYTLRDIILVPIISLIIFTLTLMGATPYLKVIIISLVLFLIIFLYSISFYKRILLVILYYFIIIISELLVTLMVPNVLNVDLESIELAYNYSFLFLGALSKFLAIIIVSIVKRKFKDTRIILPNALNYILISVLLLSIISMLLLFYAALSLASETIQFILFLICLFTLFIGLGVLTIYFSANDFYIRLQKETTKSIYNKAHEKYILNSKKREDILSKIWHDINNHIKVLEKMNIKKDDENTEYLNKLKNNINNIPNKISSGNNLVDTILNDKYLEAISHDISFHIKAVAQPKLNIDDLDLSSILFNTIDNAIEACLNSNNENKFISLDLYPEGNFLYYKIKNTNRKSSSKQIALNKKDYIAEGYGLKIIEDIVDKYDGYLDIDNDSKEYNVTIVLRLSVSN